jgi:hypothetical protein
MNPTWPVFIPSRGRAGFAPLMKELDRLGIPYRIIVEEFEHDAYARCYGDKRVLVLPQRYLEEYDSGDPEGDAAGLPYGPGCPRNYALDLAEAEGAAWHWTIDDNVRYFARIDGNHCIRAGDGWVLAAMEEHAARYLNVGLAGPEYKMFVPVREKWPRPFRYNRRVMSCQLIRTAAALPLRWRFRYNDDIDFTIRMLLSGWCTLNYLAFVQAKSGTQHVKGGSSDTIYAGGTLRKTEVLVRAHPRIVKPVLRFGRPHHDVDWSGFNSMVPVRDPAWQPPASSPYATRLIGRVDPRDPRAPARAAAARQRRPS